VKIQGFEALTAAGALLFMIAACSGGPMASADPAPEPDSGVPPPQIPPPGPPPIEPPSSSLACSTNEFGFRECLVPGARLVGGGVWSPTFVAGETWVVYERDDQSGGSRFWMTALDGSADVPLSWPGSRVWAGPGDPALWAVEGTTLFAVDPWSGSSDFVVSLPAGFSIAAPEGEFTVAGRSDGTLIAVDLSVGTTRAVPSPIQGLRPHRLLATATGRIFVNAEDRDASGARPSFRVEADGSARRCPDYAHPYLAQDGWVYGFPAGNRFLMRSTCDGDEEVVFGPLPPQERGAHVSVVAGKVAISLASTVVLGDGAVVASHSAAPGRDGARLSPSGRRVAVNSGEGLKIVELP